MQNNKPQLKQLIHSINVILSNPKLVEKKLFRSFHSSWFGTIKVNFELTLRHIDVVTPNTFWVYFDVENITIRNMRKEIIDGEPLGAPTWDFIRRRIDETIRSFSATILKTQLKPFGELDFIKFSLIPSVFIPQINHKDNNYKII
jgi:hypothetical protein